MIINNIYKNKEKPLTIYRTISLIQRIFNHNYFYPTKGIRPPPTVIPTCASPQTCANPKCAVPNSMEPSGSSSNSASKEGTAGSQSVIPTSMTTIALKSNLILHIISQDTPYGRVPGPLIAVGQEILRGISMMIQRHKPIRRSD